MATATARQILPSLALRARAATETSEVSAACAHLGPSRIAPTTRARRFPFLRELAVVLGAYFAYFAVRGATEGDVALAIEHAELIQNFERGLGLFLEPRLQSAILGHTTLINLANWVYVWGHWPVIVGVGVWLYRSRPQRYRLVRNALLISGAIGLVIFTVFPVAPPRLAEFGLVDTVVQRSNFYHVLQPPALTNQYAALPSLHFGWNLLVGIALIRGATHPAARALGFLLPAAMLVAVVVTANHYLVDTVAGGTIALIGLRTAYIIQTPQTTERRQLCRLTRTARRQFRGTRAPGTRTLAADRNAAGDPVGRRRAGSRWPHHTDVRPVALHARERHAAAGTLHPHAPAAAIRHLRSNRSRA